MKVAIVSDYLLDYVGGAQTSMAQQRASLEAAGHEVVMIAADRAVRATRRDSSGMRIRPVFTLPGLLLPVIPNRPALIALLREYFAAESVQVVHVQTEFGLAQAATTAAYELQVPVVHTVHTFYWQSSGVGPTLAAPLMKVLLKRLTRARIGDTPLSERPSDSILRNLTLAMARRADVVVSPSAHQARDLEAALVERPVAVVPNPIGEADVPAHALTAEQATSPRFLWVARCEPEKRPLVFAQAALDALARTGGFDVDFVGDGSELSQLRALTAGEPRIRVHGSLGHDRVLELMDASSAVVLTSYGFDNQPMTIAESVSRLRGVLYCDPKLSEGLKSAGHLAASPDAAGLAEALVTLVSEPSSLVALSEGARADAKEFSGRTFVTRILGVYARAVRESR
jgi:glycosyltransferase involved in cell wall biosynthesis